MSAPRHANFAVSVLPDADALAGFAADWLLARVREDRDPVSVCLSGGSTPLRLYKRLAGEPYRSRFPWTRVHWFWGDERHVPPGDPRSNAGAARRALLDGVPIPPGHIHPIPTLAPDPGTDARAYEAALKAFHGADRLDPDRPLFTAVLLGLGDDGHVASLFPGDPALNEGHRWAVPVPRSGQPFVPRITLTLPALCSSAATAFLVSGEGKRERLARVLAGADVPATRVRSGGELRWIVDRTAAGE
jgi:6-phosphogluconolactonase